MSGRRLFGRAEAGAWLGTVAALSIAGVLLAPLALFWLPGNSATPLVIHAEPMTIPWASLAASLAVAAGSATLAVALGAAFAAILVLVKMPCRNLLGTLLLFPFLGPATVWTLGQIYCYGAGGLAERCFPSGWHALGGLRLGPDAATMLVLAQINAPLAMLIIARGMRRLHHSGFDAARLFLRRTVLLRWMAGAVRQELIAALFLAFVLALGNFAVPHVLQSRLYPLEIYLRVSNYLDQRGAALLALVPLTIAVAAAALLALSERRLSYASAQPNVPAAELSIKGWLWPAVAALLVYLALTTLLPLGAMVYECGSFEYFLDACRQAGPETENTMWIALQSSLLACVAGTIVGVWASRGERFWHNLLAVVPIAVPGLVLGIAYARFYSRWSANSFLESSSVVVVLGLTARAWPFATRIVANGSRRIAQPWSEAATLSELGAWRRGWWVTGPLLASHVAAAAVVAFVLSVGDVEISQMLCAPGYGTLSLRLFTFMHTGPTHVAANLAVLQLLIAVLPALMYSLATNRYLPIA